MTWSPKSTDINSSEMVRDCSQQVFNMCGSCFKTAGAVSGQESRVCKAVIEAELGSFKKF